MKVIETDIPDVKIIEPAVFGDERGFFMETYAQKDFEEIGITATFVQDNHSKSSKGVLRGMHFQTMHTQAKLVRVIQGSVLDVVVDMRPESKTYGEYFSIELSAQNKRMFYVPERFAHGFLTLENGTEFTYKCTDYYCPEGDGGIAWNDSDIAIDWQFEKYNLDILTLNISEKDHKHPNLKDINPNELWK